MEEEKYTNKVIEYFNAGLLKIDSNDRNITLRAYLAEKLGCDPMRITKKYTGSSCLGKRVYHFDHVNVSTEGVERASQELKKLEEAFQQKLIQMNQRRFNDLHSTLEACHTVSTPTIDALMKRNRAHRPIVPLVPTSSTLPQAYISNISNLTYPAPLYAPYSNMQPVFMYPSAANAQQFLMPNVPTTFPSAHGYWYGNQLVYPPQNIAPMPTVSAENNMPPPPSAPKEEACVSEIATESLESQDNQHAEGQQDIAADFWSPLKTIAHMEDIKQSVPAESSPPMKVAKVQSDDETSVENSIGTNSTSYSRSMQKRKVEVIDEEDLISSNKRIKPSSDSQQTNSQHQSAAHSFLDFICHVKKISSQEDLAEFFEGVQKSVATSSNATKSPAASTASNNKSSSTLVSRGSVDSFQKMITPSIGII